MMLVQICASPAALGYTTLRVADKVGDDVGIEQVTHQSSTGSGAASGIGRKILLQRGQQRQQGFRRSGLDDQFVTLLANDGVFAGKLKLAGKAHRLVSVRPVLAPVEEIGNGGFV